MSIEYQTSDFSTVCVLILRRHRLLKVDRSNPQRVVFFFADNKKLQSDLTKLADRKLKVDPFDFWNAARRAKSLLYEGGAV